MKIISLKPYEIWFQSTWKKVRKMKISPFKSKSFTVSLKAYWRTCIHSTLLIILRYLSVMINLSGSLTFSTERTLIYNKIVPVC